jgi:adenylate kinase
MFRAECKRGSAVGKSACSLLAAGCLLGDDVVNPIVADRIAHPDCGAGFLLDGYPRTVPQAVFLDGLLRKRRLPEPVVIHLDVPPDVVVARLSSRRQCPLCSRIYNLASQPPQAENVCDYDGGSLVRRDDDREDVIRERLRAYDALTGPVLAWYGALRCRRVDGTRPPAEISAEIALLLSPLVRAAEAGAELRITPRQ